MAPHEASVCASFLLWNEEMNEGCMVQSVSTLHKVSGRSCFPAMVLSGVGRAPNLIIILHACCCPNMSTCITSLITCSWFWVVLPDSPGMPMQLLYVTHACVCSFEKRSSFSQAQTQQQYNLKYLSYRGRTRETGSERLSATAGSEITNSIVLCWATCLLSNFLLATSEGRKVWRKRGRRGRLSMLPVPLIFLFVCGKQKKISASSCP